MAMLRSIDDVPFPFVGGHLDLSNGIVILQLNDMCGRYHMAYQTFMSKGTLYRSFPWPTKSPSVYVAHGLLPFGTRKNHTIDSFGVLPPASLATAYISVKNGVASQTDSRKRGSLCSTAHQGSCGLTSKYAVRTGCLSHALSTLSLMSLASACCATRRHSTTACVTSPQLATQPWVSRRITPSSCPPSLSLSRT